MAFLILGGRYRECCTLGASHKQAPEKSWRCPRTSRFGPAFCPFVLAAVVYVTQQGFCYGRSRTGFARRPDFPFTSVVLKPFLCGSLTFIMNFKD